MSARLDPILTRVAHTGADELRFHGHKVFADLLGRVSVGQMLMLGISGKLLDADATAAFDDIVTVMSSADPRMWPFKMTRLGAAYGLASFGTAISLIGAEGGMFGPNRMMAATQWLLDLERDTRSTALTDTAILHALDRDTRAFGVLYRARDERFEALAKQIYQRGRQSLRFTSLCLRAVKVARELRNIEPHVFLIVAAIGLDLGLAPPEIASIASVLLFHDALANAVEGAQQRPVALHRIPLDRVTYIGRKGRISDRKALAAL